MRYAKYSPDLATDYIEQDIRTHFSFDVSSNKLRQLGWNSQVSLYESQEVRASS